MKIDIRDEHLPVILLLMLAFILKYNCQKATTSSHITSRRSTQRFSNINIKHDLKDIHDHSEMVVNSGKIVELRW